MTDTDKFWHDKNQLLQDQVNELMERVYKLEQQLSIYEDNRKRAAERLITTPAQPLYPRGVGAAHADEVARLTRESPIGSMALRKAEMKEDLKNHESRLESIRRIFSSVPPMYPKGTG